MDKKREAVLCFVFFENKVLMINRNRSPFMGLWNALGGKVEDGETPSDAAIREIKEECGISVPSVTKLSRFTWNYDDEVGYAFICTIDSDSGLFPLKTEEGIVDFKDVSWVLNEKNFGVIEDLRVFLKDVERGEKNDYHLIYDGKKLVDVIVK